MKGRRVTLSERRLTQIKWMKLSLSSENSPMRGIDLEGNKWYRSADGKSYIVALADGSGGCGSTEMEAWDDALSKEAHP